MGRNKIAMRYCGQAKADMSSQTDNEEEECTSSLPLLSLDPALQTHVLTFLSEKDCHNVLRVNRHFRHLLCDSKEGDFIWRGHAIQRWPFLVADRVDFQSITSTLGGKDMPANNPSSMKDLLRLAATSTPTDVSEYMLVSHLQTVEVSQQQDDMEKTNHKNSLQKAVQFTGRVGRGDRSFRTDTPLPRPVPRTDRSPRRRLWQRLFRRHKQQNSPENQEKWRPFVSPFLQKPGQFCFAPRSIAYFEIDIHDEQQAQGQSMSVNYTNTRRTDCVVIGVSTHRFQLHRRMPGWDDISFGYHGDDGSVFHREPTGAKYGPRFGAGDVVGCGIDYRNISVFYTLNGKFLGYAHTLDDEQVKANWYPTIGMDTHSLVSPNFGTARPFAYDLAAMVKRSPEKQ